MKEETKKIQKDKCEIYGNTLRSFYFLFIYFVIRTINIFYVVVYINIYVNEPY